jgi:hypothetical protein
MASDTQSGGHWRKSDHIQERLEMPTCSTAILSKVARNGYTYGAGDLDSRHPQSFSLATNRHVDVLTPPGIRSAEALSAGKSFEAMIKLVRHVTIKWRHRYLFRESDIECLTGLYVCADIVSMKSARL